MHTVGDWVGTAVVGKLVGALVGDVGCGVGETLGLLDGAVLGAAVGAVGAAVGIEVVGASVGYALIVDLHTPQVTGQFFFSFFAKNALVHMAPMTRHFDPPTPESCVGLWSSIHAGVGACGNLQSEVRLARRHFRMHRYRCCLGQTGEGDAHD